MVSDWWRRPIENATLPHTAISPEIEIQYCELWNVHWKGHFNYFCPYATFETTLYRLDLAHMQISNFFSLQLFSLKMHPFSDFPPKKRKRLKIDNEARGILRNFLRGGGRRVPCTTHHVFIVGPSEKIARFSRVMGDEIVIRTPSPFSEYTHPVRQENKFFFSLSGEWVWAGRYIARKGEKWCFLGGAAVRRNSMST